jgi:homoserine O-acetyltransferase
MQRRTLLAALPMTPAILARAAHAAGDTLDKVQRKVFSARSFHLESGVVLPEIVIAYETYGTLAPDGRNAVLLTHGYT